MNNNSLNNKLCVVVVCREGYIPTDPLWVVVVVVVVVGAHTCRPPLGSGGGGVGGTGVKYLKMFTCPRTSIPKFSLVLLPNNTGHSRKYNLALYFLTCLLDIG